MIRARSALRRHVENFFREELVGIFEFDKVKIRAPEKRPAPQITRTRRGRLEREGREGKFHDTFEIEFGLFNLRVASPTEEPPLGRIWLDAGPDMHVEGPLAPETWKRCGNFIREMNQ